MRVLFVVSGPQETRTVFRLAERMADAGQRVLILFAGGGRRHAADPELIGSLHFAEGVYALRGGCGSREGLGDPADGVETVNYDGWVGLLEACDRVVSWT